MARKCAGAAHPEVWPGWQRSQGPAWTVRRTSPAGHVERRAHLAREPAPHTSARTGERHVGHRGEALLVRA